MVVKVSNKKVNREILWERGVEVNDSNDDSRWDRSVVFPDPDSPLSRSQLVAPIYSAGAVLVGTDAYRNTAT